MADFPSSRKLVAIGYVRAMSGNESGGSQPHVFETEDGHYMVKVRNNPQGLRVLVNELVGGLCLDWLGVKHPEPAIVTIDPALIALSPAAKFPNGQALASGSAFGSKLWQSDPGGSVPVNLIENKADVAGTLAFDTWIQQFDGRQYRVRPSALAPGRYDYFPVDQGFSFGNPNWTAAGLDGGHNPVTVPTSITPLTAADIVHFIDRLRAFASNAAEHIVNEIPDDWLDNALRPNLKNYMSERAKNAVTALEAKFPK